MLARDGGRGVSRHGRVYSATTLRVRFVSSQPRDWCSPRESFGRLESPDNEPLVRVWHPPDPDRDPVAVSKFRAAVMQNVIAVHVRGFKNLKGVAQEELARRDNRADSMRMWNARLCGRANLTAQDMATLVMVLPGAMPDEDAIGTFIKVAEGTMARPKFWDYPDSSASRSEP